MNEKSPSVPAPERIEIDGDVEREYEFEEHQEPWLISYADLMTLLFSLFAMMFSFASFDAESVKKMEKALKRNFSGQEMHLKEQLRKSLKPWTGPLEVRSEDGAVVVDFASATFFTSGHSQLLPEAEAKVQQIVQLVKREASEASIRVEGHTDDVPISSAQFPSNWELSSARAATIIRLFESAGFPAANLEAIGYGSARPLLPNNDSQGIPVETNRAKNRRVLIKISF